MDEFYNERFANKIVSLISKMDDDEAEMFMRFSTYDVLMADIEANRRTVDRRVAEVHKRLQNGVARAAASLVSKNASLDLAEVAALVGVVSKGKTPYEELYHKEQPRGKGGRWSVSISRDTYKGPKEGEVRQGPNRKSGHVMVGPNFNLTSSLDNAGERTSAFAQEWTRDDPRHASTNYRTYQRLQAGSEALMHSNDPKVKAAGKVGQFFGQYGPEAEKVVGPRLRKTAYRYRGTERRPDAALIQQANESSRQLMRNEGTDELTEAMRVHASQTAATHYLASRLPNKTLSELQQKSGKIPPSEGVIINADGKIITQSIGYMDDHYLPFNLKNLKGLQGGHYVRSRSQGGLTTEDIYTGLVSGARSVTVVSRSGVFTMTFEDDFRGGRRYNDKAAQMVGRYAKTLDAVQSKDVTREPLKPEELAEIRDEVEAEYEGEDYPGVRADIEDAVKERVKEYRRRPGLTKAEIQDIETRARKDNDDEHKYRIARSELISAAMDAKAERHYQLDGEGYDAAMQALKEQFPYYIASTRAIHRKNATFDNPFTSEQDKGYVKPRFNRPEGAKEGYYDPTITGSTGERDGKAHGKVSADRTNYQNWAYNPERKRVGQGALMAVNGEGGTTTGAPVSAGDQRRKDKEAIARGTKIATGNASLKKLVDIYGGGMETEDLKSYPTIRSAVTDFDTVVDSPGQRTKLMEELQRAHSRAQGKKGWEDDVAQAETLFKAVKASQAGSHWDIDKAGEKPDQPFEFDLEGGKKVAYSAAANDVEIEHEWAAQTGKAGVKLSIGQISDSDLAKRAQAYGRAGHALASGNGDDVAEYMAANGVPQEEITRALNAVRRGDPSKTAKDFLKKSEAFHRLRRLQWNHSGETPKPKESTSQEVGHPVEEEENTNQDKTTSGAPPLQLTPNRTVFDQPDYEAAEKAFRIAAENASKADDKRRLNWIARSTRNRRHGVLDQAQYMQDLRDELLEVDTHQRNFITSYLKRYGIDPTT